MRFVKAIFWLESWTAGKSEEKVESMTELTEQEIADAWMRRGGLALFTNARIMKS
jgi:hypothetical protein